jgi:hypothetical protein
MAAISKVQLYGQIQKVQEQDDGTIKVYGIVSSESVDSAGEIVRADAVRKALDGYMRFPALREMHGLSAAGTTLEIGVDDDGITRIVGHVVDENAIRKVKQNVYRGFSLGGKVTKRNGDNSKIIEGITINEISLVDRPAQPDAVLEVWKADGMTAPAAPLGQKPITGDAMDAVSSIGGLSLDKIREALALMSNEDRAELLVSVVMRSGIGRRF